MFRTVAVVVAALIMATTSPSYAQVIGPPGGPNCESSYPDFCLPIGTPDLDCPDMARMGYSDFNVLQPDPHRFDADKDGIGCETTRQ